MCVCVGVIAVFVAVVVVVASADDVTPRVAALRNLYRSGAPPPTLALAAAVALITCCSVNMARQRECALLKHREKERATVSERVRARDSSLQC